MKSPLMEEGTKKEKPMADEKESQPKTKEILPPKIDAAKAPDERTVNLEDVSNSSAKDGIGSGILESPNNNYLYIDYLCITSTLIGNQPIEN